jgi:polar amino acid transport system substrate-binding protein
MNHSLPHDRRVRRWLGTLGASLICLAAAMPALAAGALDRARDTGKLTFGYRADTRPFSYTDESGKAAGFSVALCQNIADTVKADLKLPALAVEFVPLTAANRFEALKQGQIDLLCGTSTPTLERRAMVDFSIPVFSAGVGAVVRTDLDRRLRDALANKPDPSQPVWRGAPGLLTEKVVFAVVGGTTIEKSLIDALKARRIEVTVASVADYASGLQMVADRRAAAFFGDRPVLLDAAKRGPAAGDLLVIDRVFTREPLALAMQRGDHEFRLTVDRSLSRLFRSPDIVPLYTRYFGAPNAGAMEFFRFIALPD